LGEAVTSPPQDGSVSGLQTDSVATSPAPGSQNKSQGKFPFVAFGLILLGLTLIGGSSFMAFRKKRGSAGGGNLDIISQCEKR
jgi:hypothetical protein